MSFEYFYLSFNLRVSGLTGKHTLSNTSLSSDSGLNSNNNSSYASTLSRCSNNAARYVAVRDTLYCASKLKFVTVFS